MEESQVIHVFPKNPDEEVRFSIRTYKERRYLDVRLWFRPSAGGDYRPTKKGITVGVEHVQEFHRGIEQALQAASAE